MSELDELIKALEKERDSALMILGKTSHYGLQAAYRTRAETFNDAVFIAKRIQREAQTRGQELPY